MMCIFGIKEVHNRSCPLCIDCSVTKRSFYVCNPSQADMALKNKLEVMEVLKWDEKTCLRNGDYVCQFVKKAFSGDWIGGNDFGHRAYIRDISLNIGQISIIFNNDTGSFEWVDFGYGYFEIYEENPYGIIADMVQEFLDKFELVKI